MSEDYDFSQKTVVVKEWGQKNFVCQSSAKV